MINGIVIDKKSRMVYKYEAAKIKVGESHAYMYMPPLPPYIFQERHALINTFIKIPATNDCVFTKMKRKVQGLSGCSVKISLEC